MSAVEALAAASAAGIRITLDGDGLILEAPKLPRDVVAMLKSVKPDLLRVLAAREVAQAVLSTPPPADCPDDRWQEAMRGLDRFVAGELGRQSGADRLDAGRALSRSALMEPDRSHGRGAARRLSAGHGGDCRQHRHRVGGGVAAQISPDRPRAPGMTFPLFPLFRCFRGWV